MTKKKCQCFYCKFQKHKDLLRAYCEGHQAASKWFINWADRNNIGLGLIGDKEKDDLPVIYAEMLCNYDDTSCYMSGLPELDANRESYEDLEGKVLGLESELEETLKVLYKAAPEKREWIKLNFPKFYRKLEREWIKLNFPKFYRRLEKDANA